MRDHKSHIAVLYLFFLTTNNEQNSDALKWFTQVNLPPNTKEQNEVYQLIIDSKPSQMDNSMNDADARVEPIEHNVGWYLSRFTTLGNEWRDFMDFIKEEIATIVFLGKRVVLFHGDTYIKQKLSLSKKDSVPVSVEDVFVRNRHSHRKLLIEADAGQGKTSLLRHATFLISQAASEQNNSVEKRTIGFYLRADTLSNELNIPDREDSKDRSGINLETVIRVFLRQCRSSLARLCEEHMITFVKTKVDSVVLLIDSLDELSQARRILFLNWINQISNQGMVLDDNTMVHQIVIASRPIPEGIQEFSQYTIESLSILQQKAFIIKHFGATAESELRISPKSWQDLIEQIISTRQKSTHNEKKLEELVNICIETLECRDALKTQGNPLLLFLLCLHLEQSHNNPVKRNHKETRLFGLYESIIEMTIERSQERLHSDPRFRSLFVPWQAERSRAWLLDLMTVTAFACHWIGSQNKDSDDLCPRKDTVSSVLSAIHNSKLKDWKLYSVLQTQEELLMGQDLVEVLVSLPGLCQLTREDNPSVYFVNRTIQEFLTARCALAMFDGLKLGRESSDSWRLLCDVEIAGVDSIPKSDFWKNERIICSKWWSRVILFAATYHQSSNESGLEWLWQSIDAPEMPGIDRKDLGMVRLWHLLQVFPSVWPNVSGATTLKLDEMYLWVLDRSPIGAFRLVEENTNVGVLFGKRGLERSKNKWKELCNSKDNITKQLADKFKKWCESQANPDGTTQASNVSTTNKGKDDITVNARPE